MNIRSIGSWVWALALLGATLSLAGCAVGGLPTLLGMLLASSMLVLAGCSSSHRQGDRSDRDGGPEQDGGHDGGVVDRDGDVVGSDGGGYWGPCCADGVIDTCFCPAGLACNFGWFTDCGDGTCLPDPSATCGGSDGGVRDGGRDGGGHWESCCNDGRVDLCFCPAGVACNYGWYEDC